MRLIQGVLEYHTSPINVTLLILGIRFSEVAMKAVIYSRVSTDEQTTANQIPVLKSWASQFRLNFNMTLDNAEPLEVVEVYSENESAWRDGHQRELSRLMSNAQQGRFKVVLVWALDRLSRQGVRAILELIHKLGVYGVRVYSYQEAWTLTPSNELYELLLALTGWVGNYESRRRSERTKAGMRRKIKEGWTPGRPKGSKDKKMRQRRYWKKEYAGYIKDTL
jgi:DNA invertase Pin-like site-specific DNA recombinase